MVVQKARPRTPLVDSLFLRSEFFLDSLETDPHCGEDSFHIFVRMCGNDSVMEERDRESVDAFSKHLCLKDVEPSGRDQSLLF